jgi:4-carboxymuconolactone decarboxylase
MPQTDYDRTADFEKGVALRKEVLGDAHVERSLARGKEDLFMLPIQQLTTDVGWGKVWARPGLERRVRSMLSVTLLAALGKKDELKTHLQGALNNGVTKDEIQEVLLHTSVYAGFPVGLEAFRVAKELFDGLDAEAARKGERAPE